MIITDAAYIRAAPSVRFTQTLRPVRYGAATTVPASTRLSTVLRVFPVSQRVSLLCHRYLYERQGQPSGKDNRTPARS